MLSLDNAIEAVSWQDALADFTLDLRGKRAPKTVAFYACQLRQLLAWTTDHQVAIGQFRARHMREYLADRAETGVSKATRRHDCICARAFLAFCVREGYLAANPLAGYEVPKAPKPYVKMPSAEELQTLLAHIRDRWNPAKAPAMRFVRPRERRFFGARDYAMITGLVCTAARAGELLGLALDDFQADVRQVSIRAAKGQEPRVVPISAAWAQVVEEWLRVRPACNCDRLFITEYGEPIGVEVLSRKFARYVRGAGLSGFSLHGLRHFALTRLAETNLLAASFIAGHKDLATTRAYMHKSAAHLRQAYDQADPLGAVMVHKESAARQRRRKVL